MPSLVTPSFSKGCTQNRYRRFGNDSKIKLIFFRLELRPQLFITSFVLYIKKKGKKSHNFKKMINVDATCFAFSAFRHGQLASAVRNHLKMFPRENC